MSIEQDFKMIYKLHRNLRCHFNMLLIVLIAKVSEMGGLQSSCDKTIYAYILSVSSEVLGSDIAAC